MTVAKMTRAQQEEYHALAQENGRLMSELSRVRKRMTEMYDFGSLDYRIALRPDDHTADPLAWGTLMDDIVVEEVPMFRAEQMTEKNWWVACYLDKETQDRICWSVTARSRPLRIEWTTTEFPENPGRYEHEAKA